MKPFVVANRSPGREDMKDPQVQGWVNNNNPIKARIKALILDDVIFSPKKRKARKRVTKG